MTFNDEEKASLELFKHYSGIRFLLLPLFFTTMGSTAIAYWTVISGSVQVLELTLSISLAGMLLSLFFCVYEIRLSLTLLKMSNLLPTALAPLRHGRVWGWVTTVTLLLYGAPFVFWSWRAWADFWT